MWRRKGSGLSVRTWPGLQVKEEWISSERAWVLLEDGKTKIASCFVYLRVEAPRSSLFFKQNEALLSHLSTELNHLKVLGFKTCVQGDFNAHVDISDNFAFHQYPHPVNNNGSLLSEFAILNDLYCMNPMSWDGKRKDSFTFQRDMGGRLLRSIVDYGLASPGAIDSTTSFTIEDSEMYAAESDHSSLLWSFSMGTATPTLPKPFNTLKAINNWASFTSTLEKRLVPSVDFFSGLPSSAQGTFLTAELRAVGNSSSPGRITGNAYRSPISRKIKSLLSHKKFLRMSLRGVKVASSTIATDLRKQLREASLNLRKQYFADSLRQKKRMKAILCSKGPKAQKLFWDLINHKGKEDSGIDALEMVGSLSFYIIKIELRPPLHGS